MLSINWDSSDYNGPDLEDEALQSLGQTRDPARGFWDKQTGKLTGRKFRPQPKRKGDNGAS